MPAFWDSERDSAAHMHISNEPHSVVISTASNGAGNKPQCVVVSHAQSYLSSADRPLHDTAPISSNLASSSPQPCPNQFCRYQFGPTGIRLKPSVIHTSRNRSFPAKLAPPAHMRLTCQIHRSHHELSFFFSEYVCKILRAIQQ